MIQRAFSTLLLWSIVIAIVVIGKTDGAFVLLLLLSGLAQAEFYWLAQKRLQLLSDTVGLKQMNPVIDAPLRGLGILLGTAMLVYIYRLPELAHSPQKALTLITGLVFLLALIDGFRFGFNWTRFPLVKGLIYIPGLLAAFPLMWHQHDSLMLIIWVVAVAKFNDAGALLGGKLLGRHKLAPVLSPGKTVEGAACGLLTGTIVGVALMFLPALQATNISPAYAAVVSLILGPISILSDLLESWLKRRAGVKDSGGIIPGIGGMLDLVDSLLLCAPVAYLCFLLA